MKNYKVTFNGVIVLFFNGVSYRERVVDTKFCNPFKVVEFLKGNKVVVEFYPCKYFDFKIEEMEA